MLFSLITIISNAFAFDINIKLYENKHEWQITPNIIVCNDSPVPVEQVEKAAQIWRNNGIKIGTVRKQLIPEECTKDYNRTQYGSMIVSGKLRFLNENLYNGFTTNYHPVTNNYWISSSIIEINKDKIITEPSYTHKLLVHEIGHAIGYDHFNFSKNDIMKPSLQNVH